MARPMGHDRKFFIGGMVSGTAEAQRRGPTPVTARLRYHPALDGLRALAVLAVIAYHVGYAWARGGFLGVDAFFVLSGFLITSLLCSRRRGRRHDQPPAFWARRGRRLLPALLLVLLARRDRTAGSSVPPIELASSAATRSPSLFYVANWRFIATGPVVLRHSSPRRRRCATSGRSRSRSSSTWSGRSSARRACRSAHGPARAAARRCCAVAASSVGGRMALLYEAADPSRAYYGTDTRAHALLVGASSRSSHRPTAAHVRGRGAASQVVGLVGAVGVLVVMHSADRRAAVSTAAARALRGRAVARDLAVVQPAGRRSARCSRSRPLAGSAHLLRPLPVALAHQHVPDRGPCRRSGDTLNVLRLRGHLRSRDRVLLPRREPDPARRAPPAPRRAHSPRPTSAVHRRSRLVRPPHHATSLPSFPQQQGHQYQRQPTWPGAPRIPRCRTPAAETGRAPRASTSARAARSHRRVWASSTARRPRTTG